jgi:3-hydroxymyristoyl/3-hydroxydecanoyl-(acyl carrier protein) dehydratase/1-acyl-sn-glycerol-3-phosphate acyltransferase
VNRDGWRFEPVPDSPIPLRCRGQATPTSKHLVYEVFVEEVWDDDHPVLWADLLCTVDGLKAFHAKRVGLKLTPSWPMDDDTKLLRDAHSRSDAALVPVAVAPDGHTFDYTSLLACAWGRPSQAFGSMYAPFDDVRRVARLPGPPYHFMSRIAEVDGPIGGMKIGTSVVVEYDIPEDAWYFDQSPGRTMPFAVLLEAALQPCGWLASYVGSALTSDIDLKFRNLDGTSTLYREIRPGDGTMTTRSTITNISQSAGMIIESFTVQCLFGDEVVYDMTTVFGFFPSAALESQVGIPPTDAELALKNAPTEVVADVSDRWGLLRNIDRVMLHDLTGGKAGLGRLLSAKDCSPDEWFFKAHFFQDPVQPGSLGLEALLQLLQYHLGETLPPGDWHFEPIATGRPLTWKYRGQVIPTDKTVVAELEITEQGEDDKGHYVLADGYLWTDDRRIYSATGMAMRAIPAEPKQGETLSLDSHPWLGDHRPTWTLAALPMMSMVHRLLEATGAAGLDSMTVRRWVTPPAILTTRQEAGVVSLLADGEAVASATAVTDAGPPPSALSPLSGPEAANPYEAGTLFHGPTFQRLRSLVVTEAGASATLDASCPREILLDASTHAIPHDDIRRWFPTAQADAAAYPLRIDDLRLWGPTPTGTVRCEVRPAGILAGLPKVEVQVIDGDRVWCAYSLTEVLVPKGPIGLAAPADRVAFLRDRQFVPGLALSTLTGDTTSLTSADLQASDWLPGTVAAVYGLGERQGDDALEAIAIADHIGARLEVHPSQVSGDRSASLPLNPHPVVVERTDDSVVVRDAPGPAALDLTRITTHWGQWFGLGGWPVEDLFYGLIQRFVRRLVLTDPEAFEACQGRSIVYLANHQVGVESLLFSILASGLNGVNTVTLAKDEHRDSWLGNLIRQSFAYPGVEDPEVITYFDREDRESLPRIIGELAVQLSDGDKSVMVHVEGTRSLSCRTPVQKMSGAFVDMAIKTGSPVVPVRFVGALPTETMASRLEFPIGWGAQDIYLGRPMHPEELSALPYKERKEAVVAAINDLGPANAIESPLPSPDPGFAASVDEWSRLAAVSPDDAVLRRILESTATPCEETLLALGGDDLPDDEKGRWLLGLRDRMGST